MSDCLFCKIIAGDLPSTKIYEDDLIIAFNDLYPKAPVHFLVIPKIHISSCDGINTENCDVIARIFKAIPELASKANISGGYRVVTNCGEDGGQTVGHLHFHVLGGRKMDLNFG